MARRTYTDDEKAAGLAALTATGGDVRKAGRIAAVPARTLARWRDTAPDLKSKIATVQAMRLAAMKRRIEASVAGLDADAPRTSTTNKPASLCGRGRSPVAKGVACVYLVVCDRFHKVGVSSNLPARLAAMQASCPHAITVDSVATVPSQSSALALEDRIHDMVWHRRHRGEWFDLSADEVEAVRGAMVRGCADAACAA